MGRHPTVLSWSAVDKAKNYTVELQMSYEGQTITGLVNVKKPSLSSNAIPAGFTITWRVRAVNKDVVSDWSASNTFMVVAPLQVTVSTSDGTYSGQVVASGGAINIAQEVSVTLTASESGFWYLTPPPEGGPAGQINIMPSNSVTLSASWFRIPGDYQIGFEKQGSVGSDWSATITVAA